MQVNSPQITQWSEHFAVLAFQGLQLLIPQTDIYSLEPIADLIPVNNEYQNAVGQFKQGEQVWAVYALSADLDVLDSRPESSRVIVLMKNVQPEYGLLCEQVDTRKRSEISIHPLPAAVQGKNSPLLAMAVMASELRYISSASALNSLFLP